MGDPAELLRMMGGSASRGALLRHTTRRGLETAVHSGTVVRLGHGRYGLPELRPALKTAAALNGVVSHLSAATYWSFDRLVEPASVHLTIPSVSHRRPTAGVTLHYAPTDGATSLGGRVTAPVRTVLDCAQTLPFREGLAVADSALRSAKVGKHELVQADLLTGPGCRQARKVAAHADLRADNPFESALRAIVIEAGLSGLVPQLDVRCGPKKYRVDLGHEQLRMVAEADSFEHHGSRAALARDCKRYDELVRFGWSVLRFAWEQVMFEREWVAAVAIDTYVRRQAELLVPVRRTI